MNDLKRLIESIGDLDGAAMQAAKERQENLTKPPGSLGVLEQLSIRLAGITGSTNNSLKEKCVVVMAGDHGIAAKGVSAYPPEVTAQMLLNFAAGGAAINVLARHVGAKVVVVDMGCRAIVESPGVLVKKIKPGTDDISTGPAMSRAQAEEAIAVGAGLVSDLIESGVDIFATGDMGIGNTTASSAVISVLGGIDADETTGRGTGIDEAARKNKVALIKQAIEVNAVEADDPIDVLAKLGGLEIAGITGVILGAAAGRRPVVIDGFISGAAALTAAKLAPKAVPYMIGSHLSVEPGHKLALAEIGLGPMLHMDMRLGEGTGAALAMTIVEAAAKILSEMATFAEAGVSESSSPGLNKQTVES